MDTIKLQNDFRLKIPIQRWCIWFKSYHSKISLQSPHFQDPLKILSLGSVRPEGICQSFLILQLLDKMMRQLGHWKVKHPNQDFAGLEKIKVMYKIASPMEQYQEKWRESIQLQKIFKARSLTVSYFHLKAGARSKYSLCLSRLGISC